MDLEKHFIDPIARASKLQGDDGAFAEGYVYSTDAFVEGTHFKMAWMSLTQIAYKALAVNISDAVAMNARARYLLLAVGIPGSFTAHQTRELSRGFVDAAREFGCEIIGGDTVRSDRLTIAVTVISHTDKPLRRTGVKPGDLLAYTGRLGGAAKSLRYLLSGGIPHADSLYVRPTLRTGFVYDAAPSLRAGMDISDGVFTDLQRLCALNRLGVRFFKPIPKAMGCSGEEYEMLIVFAPRLRRRIAALAKKHRVKLTIFGKAARRRYVNPCKSHHF